MDPLSLTGSVVGILSLGLTTCNGLITFYSDVKDTEKDVCSILESANNFREILLSLTTIVELHLDVNAEYASAIISSMASCRRRVTALQREMAKINRTASNSQAPSLARRLQYPFKKATIAKLNELLRDARENLACAIALLQM